MDKQATKLKSMLDERAKPIEHADGVYFGLDENVYHDDPALGSTNMRDLSISPVGYWHGSHMNPQRVPEDESDAQIRGTAVHVCAFAGKEEFERRYLRGPDNDGQGFTPAEKSARTRAANERAAKLRLICLPAREYDQIAVIAETVMLNPHLAQAFTNGAAEVSVFWTETHALASEPDFKLALRKKARLDFVKPRGVGDLKSVGNPFKLPFPRACMQAITNYRYHVQAEHYITARFRMIDLILTGGCVFGPHEHSLIEALAREKRFAWQWVFWQATRAPLVWSCVLSPGNPIFDLAKSSIVQAEQNYLRYMRRYGVERWRDEERPGELFIEDMPMWFGKDF